MATRTIIIAAALVAGACEPETLDEGESDCAGWLRCYEECDPLEYAEADVDFARASIRFCAEECDDKAGRSSTPTAIAVLDEQLVDPQATASERIEAGVAALRARSACRLEEMNSAE